MKALKVIYALLLVATVALLVGLFLAYRNMGDITEEENDLGFGFALFFMALLTVIPIYAALPVAGLLLITLLCFLFTRKRGSVLAAAIILGIFLPFLGFSLWLTLSILFSRSTIYTMVAISLAAVYLITFVISIVLCRKMKRDWRA